MRLRKGRCARDRRSFPIGRILHACEPKYLKRPRSTVVSPTTRQVSASVCNVRKTIVVTKRRAVIGR